MLAWLKPPQPSLSPPGIRDCRNHPVTSTSCRKMLARSGCWLRIVSNQIASQVSCRCIDWEAGAVFILVNCLSGTEKKYVYKESKLQPVIIIMIITTATTHIYIYSSHMCYVLLLQPSCIISFILYNNSLMQVSRSHPLQLRHRQQEIGLHVSN